ncbi:beta-1,6-N-acetylglucosaminyltransferase [Flavobacterium faecale]|uniref:beta-1,6-N-acetylglucosaminyltransferase n=1 Tax=Flavobacterium faecale TaxID=1355330 RepID=UPI003AAB60A3
MRIAILCIAHELSPNLKLMLGNLSKDFDIYVHMDSKYGEIDEKDFPKNVFFIKNRIKVYWSDSSQIRAMYNLLESSFNTNYSHYLFISGADFPIKSNQFILDFFKDNKNSYLDISPLPKVQWSSVGGGKDRFEKFWLTKFNNRKITCILGKITLFVQKTINFKRKSLPIEYYGGSNWSNLSHEAVAYILDYLQTNPSFMESTKYTFQMDEIWIQTILKTSQHLEVINNDLRYTDWVSGPDFPRTLDLKDYDLLTCSEAFFARKVSSTNLSLQNKILNNFIKK